MNPGNGCLIVDTASIAPGVGDPPTCEEMFDANESKRAESNHQEKPTTFTQAVINNPDGSHSTTWACSDGDLAQKYSNGRATGLADKSGD